jgi:hypothetical protein
MTNELGEMLQPMTWLHHLCLSFNNLGDGIIPYLEPLLPQLRSLQLHAARLGDSSLERLASKWHTCAELSMLSLGGNPFTDAGTVHLAPISACPKLRDLSIEMSFKFSEAAALPLATAVRCPQLTDLDLSFNELGAGGMALVAASLAHCMQLSRLNLTKVNLGSASVHLAKAKKKGKKEKEKKKGKKEGEGERERRRKNLCMSCLRVVVVVVVAAAAHPAVFRP